MSEYVSDNSGTWWKKDAFTKFWLNDEGDTLYASINGDCDEVTAEFDPSSWDHPDFTDPVVIGSSPGYFGVKSWLTKSGKLQYRCYPVVAWIYSDYSVRPLTSTAVQNRDSWAVLHPDGQVFEGDKIWPSLDDYLVDRGHELEECQRTRRLLQKYWDEKPVEAAKVVEPS